jgi:hypothetical protein
VRTYKGRVVYERIRHDFTNKDLVRIVRSLLPDEKPESIGQLLALAAQGILEKFLEDYIIIDMLPRCTYAFFDSMVQWAASSIDLDLPGTIPGLGLPIPPTVRR